MKKTILTISSLLLVLILLSQKAETLSRDAPKKKPKPQITFVELGSVNCIPCKMMQPVMKEIEAIYGDTVQVIFYDVWQPKDKAKASQYKVRVIPTQVFLDKKGREFHRHEGFYSKDEIVQLIDKKLGIKRKPVNSPSEKK